MIQRGVLYMKWGTKADDLLARSRASLAKFHPELPVHVQECPPDSNLLVKATMMDASPFETTIFLDIDTIVLGKLDYAIEKAEQFSLACCICENPWARRHHGLRDRGDLVEYNTGVLFFTRKVAPLFDRWKQVAPHIDSTTSYMEGQQVCTQAIDDHAAFAVAVHETATNPYVLPLNWNWRPPLQNSFFGPIKIYHQYSPIPSVIEPWNDEQTKPDAVIRFATLQRKQGQ